MLIHSIVGVLRHKTRLMYNRDSNRDEKNLKRQATELFERITSAQVFVYHLYNIIMFEVPAYLIGNYIIGNNAI